MMKRAACFLVLVLASACTKNSYINVDKSLIEASPDGETVTVMVDASCEWLASSSATWIKPVDISGRDRLELVISRNLTDSTRTGNVTLNGDNSHTVISVSQIWKEMLFSFDVSSTGSFLLPYISPESASATVSWNGDTQTYLPGMSVEIPFSPMSVFVKSAGIDTLTFKNIVSLEYIDLSDL